MLDQLIESKNHSGANHRRGGFLLTTFTAVTSALTLALIYSLFSYNLALANDKLDISTLVAPVIPTEAPPIPEPITEPRPRSAERTSDKLPSRQENIQRVTEVPVTAPTDISTSPNTKLSRPAGKFIIGDKDSDPLASGNQTTGRGEGDGNSPTGIAIPKPEIAKTVEETTPPPIKTPAPKPTPTQTVLRTGRVLNGQAVNLVKPPYPSPAKAVRASGAVNVQVTIDENGNVTAANAVSGHPLLRQASEQAARSSKFSSTFLGDQKVKVTGVIVYNFVAQ